MPYNPSFTVCELRGVGVCLNAGDYILEVTVISIFSHGLSVRRIDSSAAVLWKCVEEAAAKAVFITCAKRADVATERHPRFSMSSTMDVLSLAIPLSGLLFSTGLY